MSQENVEVVRRHHEAFVSGDREGTLEPLDPEVEFVFGVVEHPTARGHAELGEAMRQRSAPTMDTATWWRTPASCSAASRLVVEVVKNSITAWSSKEGEFETSTATEASLSTSATPSPVSVLTPVSGDAATASWGATAGDGKDSQRAVGGATWPGRVL